MQKAEMQYLIQLFQGPGSKHLTKQLLLHEPFLSSLEPSGQSTASRFMENVTNKRFSQHISSFSNNRKMFCRQMAAKPFSAVFISVCLETVCILPLLLLLLQQKTPANIQLYAMF